jgi:hypothetical protein
MVVYCWNRKNPSLALYGQNLQSLKFKACGRSNLHSCLNGRRNYTYRFTHVKIQVCFPLSNFSIIRIHDEINYVLSDLNEDLHL